MLGQGSEADVAGEAEKQRLGVDLVAGCSFVTDLLCGLGRIPSYSGPVLSPIIWRKDGIFEVPFQSPSSPLLSLDTTSILPSVLAKPGRGGRVFPSEFSFHLRFTM